MSVEEHPPEPADWIDRHAEALYRYALLQLGDPEAAEDCVQETFVAALEARRTFRGRSSQRTWLIGILKHKVCDHFRRRSRELPADDPAALAALDAMYTAGGVWKDSLRDWTWTPETMLAREDFWRAMRDCLSRLPPRLGDAFCLRELHGLNAREICQVLEVSATNLSVRLHRARALLRQCLERRWRDE